ncbi:50S ribosomal protein [Dirofilaria immitis]
MRLFGVLYPGNIIITIIDSSSNTSNIMSSTSSGSVSSRRKQAKPQRLSHESDLCSDSTITNGKYFLTLSDGHFGFM